MHSIRLQARKMALVALSPVLTFGAVMPAAAAAAAPATAASHSMHAAMERAVALSEISETLSRYCKGVDELNVEMITDTFVPEAVVIAEDAVSKKVRRWDGRDAMMATFTAERRDVRRHFVTNFWIEKISGDTATVHSYYLIVVSKDGQPSTKSTGTYKDEMVRGTDGVWRTRTKYVYLDADYK